MNRKILFGDDSTLAISISIPDEGKMATIAYNSLLGFIEDELLDHPDLSFQADQNPDGFEENDLSVEEFDEDEFEDDEVVELDEDEIDEEELEGDDWEDEDDKDDKIY